jgi:toxin ParE1/3/4
MKRRPCALTRRADDDLTGILDFTATTFGLRQLAAYAAVVDRAVALIAADPARPGSRERSDIRAGVRSFHLELAAGRRGAAAHVIYYTVGPLGDDRVGVLVLRILHERMEPAAKVVKALEPD